jgi:hypothetical protein
MRNVNGRVGRKVTPRVPKTNEEKRAQLDVVECALRAAAVQLRQVGCHGAATGVEVIADQLPAFKAMVLK